MEKKPTIPETPFDTLTKRSRKFGERVIKRVAEGYEDAVVVNPMLWGLAYRDHAVYGYIQSGLAEKGIATHISRTPMESGSDSKIQRDTLVVDARPEA